MSVDWYRLLPDHTTVRVGDFSELPRIKTPEDFDREKRVAETILSDGTRVSTVFLQLDHALSPGATPVLFETMVFPPDKGGSRQWGELDCTRYTNWDDAVKGHWEMVERWRTHKSDNQG